MSPRKPRLLNAKSFFATKRTIVFQCCLLLSVPFMLGGCATTSNYQTMLGTWQGAHIQDLILRWGPPVNSYVGPDGNRVYVFYNQNEYQAQPVGGVGLGSGGFSSGFGVGYGTGYNVTTCTTWAEVGKDNRIIKLYSQGNACTASQSDMEKLSNPYNPPMEDIKS